MPQWQSLFTVLRDHDINVSAQDMPRPVGGGDISSAWRIRADDKPVFLKTGPASSYDMFLAEAEGLRELAKADALRVPRVLGCVSSGEESMLAPSDSAGIATTPSARRRNQMPGATTGSNSLANNGWGISCSLLPTTATEGSYRQTA
jgi:hypothetical protein